MAEWHLRDLRNALARRGWTIVAEHPGDDARVSASWEVRRSTKDSTLFIDFHGLDDLRCLPIIESYACRVRAGAGLYFGRPGDRWRQALNEFVRSLDAPPKEPPLL
jgi:hypothetical protein